MNERQQIEACIARAHEIRTYECETSHGIRSRTPRAGDLSGVTLLLGQPKTSFYRSDPGNGYPFKHVSQRPGDVK